MSFSKNLNKNIFKSKFTRVQPTTKGSDRLDLQVSSEEQHLFTETKGCKSHFPSHSAV